MILFFCVNYISQDYYCELYMYVTVLSKEKIMENIMVKKFFYLVSNICHIEKFHIFDKNKL